MKEILNCEKHMAEFLLRHMLVTRIFFRLIFCHWLPPLRGRSRSSLSGLIVADGEALQGLHNRGGRGIGNGLVLERFIFARQASNFAVTLHVGNSSSLVTIGLRMLTHHVKSRAKTGFHTRRILEHYKPSTGLWDNPDIVSIIPQCLGFVHYFFL